MSILIPENIKIYIQTNKYTKVCVTVNKQEIMSRVDHTILSTTATWEQVQKICEQGMKYKTASVCIPPRYVRKASRFVGKELKICTVIGFPNGYHTPEVKVFETEDAIRNGADEIDMASGRISG